MLQAILGVYTGKNIVEVCVGVLYLGGGKYFGCRHCYNLTYECQKESGKYDRFFEKLGYDPKEVRGYYLKRGVTEVRSLKRSLKSKIN